MLKTRIVTAVIALVILGAVLFIVPPAAAQAAIALVVIAGAWEWSGFLNMKSTANRCVYVLVIAALMGAMIWGIEGASQNVLLIASAWWFVAFLWTFFFPTEIPMPVRWVCGVLVLVPVFVALFTLYNLEPKLLLFALLIVWAADIGAYFSGKTFGRVKLAPSISPGKTWEGALGGLVMVAILTVVWAHYEGMPLAVMLPFCLAVAAISIVGDLTVSMFKRTAGLKDSGKLFPGHGGVLDRIDSIAAATPMFALGLTYLELL